MIHVVKQAGCSARVLTGTEYTRFLANLPPARPGHGISVRYVPETAVFKVDGELFPIAEMLSANADDEGFCEWAVDAEIGDRFPGFIPCERVE